MRSPADVKLLAAVRAYVEADADLTRRRDEFHIALRSAWKDRKLFKLRELAELFGCSVAFISDALLRRRWISAEMASKLIGEEPGQ